LPPAPGVAAMASLGCRFYGAAGASSPLVWGSPFAQGPAPRFEKPMRAGLYGRGLRTASAGPWATFERCAGFFG